MQEEYITDEQAQKLATHMMQNVEKLATHHVTNRSYLYMYPNKDNAKYGSLTIEVAGLGTVYFFLNPQKKAVRIHKNDFSLSFTQEQINATEIFKVHEKLLEILFVQTLEKDKKQVGNFFDKL